MFWQRGIWTWAEPWHKLPQKHETGDCTWWWVADTNCHVFMSNTVPLARNATKWHEPKSKTSWSRIVDCHKKTQIATKTWNWWLHVVMGGWHELPRFHVKYRAVGTKCHEMTRTKIKDSLIKNCGLPQKRRKLPQKHAAWPFLVCRVAMSSDMKCHSFKSHDHSAEDVSFPRASWNWSNYLRQQRTNTPFRHLTSKRPQYQLFDSCFGWKLAWCLEVSKCPIGILCKLFQRMLSKPESLDSPPSRSWNAMPWSRRTEVGGRRSRWCFSSSPTWARAANGHISWKGRLLRYENVKQKRSISMRFNNMIIGVYAIAWVCVLLIVFSHKQDGPPKWFGIGFYNGFVLSMFVLRVLTPGID